MHCPDPPWRDEERLGTHQVPLSLLLPEVLDGPSDARLATELLQRGQEVLERQVGEELVRPLHVPPQQRAQVLRLTSTEPTAGEHVSRHIVSSLYRGKRVGGIGGMLY